ncbi:hypothetical protein HT031_000651 [Scenedesmus sp. PABB004]|nr:hypothetical protein HT031_000651 [Scenedesmus sp. PABB004]
MAEALGVFASPAKRRKTCLGDAGDEGPGAAESAKLAGPKSKADPRTPAGKGKAGGADDGLLGGDASPEQLPPGLLLLNQLLGAVYVTLPLVRSRGKATTFQNLRVPVQNFSGRDFQARAPGGRGPRRALPVGSTAAPALPDGGRRAPTRAAPRPRAPASQVRHVQQMRALCPEALGWEHLLTTNATTRKPEQQLLLKLAPGADTVAMQQLFFKRLQQHARAHPGAEAPLAELPPLAGPNARDCTPSRRALSSGDLLPGTPQTAPPGRRRRCAHAQRLRHAGGGPAEPAAQAAVRDVRPRRRGRGGPDEPAPARGRAGKGRPAKDGEGGLSFSPEPRQPAAALLSPAAGAGLFGTPSRDGGAGTPQRGGDGDEPSAGTPGLRPNRLFGTPVATATPQQAPAGRRPADLHATPEAAPAPAPAAAPGGVKARKLTFEAALPKAPAAKAAAAAPAEAQPAPAAKPGGLTFELGASAMALLRQVSSVEVQQSKAARQQELEQERALDMLPGTFDVLRGVFGERGACVKPKAEVVMLLRQKSTCRAGMSPAEAGEQLELMLRLVPEFVRAVHTGGQSLAGLTQSALLRGGVAAARAGAADGRAAAAVAGCLSLTGGTPVKARGARPAPEAARHPRGRFGAMVLPRPCALRCGRMHAPPPLPRLHRRPGVAAAACRRRPGEALPPPNDLPERRRTAPPLARLAAGAAGALAALLPGGGAAWASDAGAGGSVFGSGGELGADALLDPSLAAEGDPEVLSTLLIVCATYLAVMLLYLWVSTFLDEDGGAAGPSAGDARQAPPPPDGGELPPGAGAFLGANLAAPRARVDALVETELARLLPAGGGRWSEELIVRQVMRRVTSQLVMEEALLLLEGVEQGKRALEAQGKAQPRGRGGWALW